MLVSEACRPRGATMALTMTKEEREAFLADVHVAVISVAEDGHGPLVVPIWYSYEPGGEVRIITGRTSRKGELLERAGRFSLCVQAETLPYKYVSVEGPIVAVEAVDLERDGRPLARRYLGTELGDRYIEDTRDVGGLAAAQCREELRFLLDERGGFGDGPVEGADLHVEHGALFLRAPGGDDLAIDDERARRAERGPDHLALGWIRDQRGPVAGEQVGVVGWEQAHAGRRPGAAQFVEIGAQDGTRLAVPAHLLQLVGEFGEPLPGIRGADSGPVGEVVGGRGPVAVQKPPEQLAARVPRGRRPDCGNCATQPLVDPHVAHLPARTRRDARDADRTGQPEQALVDVP